MQPSKLIIDQKHAFHATELSRVIKLLDELSQKLDKFENTTRHLDGITVVKEELVKKEIVEIARDVLEVVEERPRTEKLTNTGVFLMNEQDPAPQHHKIQDQTPVTKIVDDSIKSKISLESSNPKTEQEISKKRKRFKRQKNVEDKNQKPLRKSEPKLKKRKEHNNDSDSNSNSENSKLEKKVQT